MVRKQTGKKRRTKIDRNDRTEKRRRRRKKTKPITKYLFILHNFFVFKVNGGNSTVKNLNPDAQLFSSSDFNNGTVLAGSTAPSGMFYF